MRFTTALLLSGSICAFWMEIARAQAQPVASPSPSPAASIAPSPAPSVAPSPPVSVGVDFTLAGFHANGINGLDTAMSNALLNVNAGTGNLHVTATVGQYSFPTVGFPILPANAPGANTDLYTALPVAAVQYSFNSHFNVGAGKYAALLGQESPFTYQNQAIERGIGWEMEPTISRGVQAAYTNGPWNLTLQENDAYYSGFQRAVEGLVGWAPSANTNLQFAFILPGANVGPNPTTAVGNKAEYDLMFTRTIGKLQVFPYLLFVNSPQSAQRAYTRSESATAAVLIAAWTFSPQWSLPLRYEYAANGSSTGDLSPNADLIGFGPGSHVQTITITPTFRFGNGGVLRLEYANVSLSSFSAGLGFGPSGTVSTQNRIGFELGVMH